jgi:NADH-quinone oxidoreductase subunit G
LAVVCGLSHARELIDKIRKGEEHFDLVEVMACTGGCVNGGGQPVTAAHNAIAERAKGLYNDDRMLQLHISSENPYLQQIYNDDLNEHKAHELLHTSFHNRRRILEDDIVLTGTRAEKTLSISVCLGTSCFVRGSQELYTRLTAYIREKGLEDKTEFRANFCGEHCKQGPYVVINGKGIEHCTFELAVAEINNAIK